MKSWASIVGKALNPSQRIELIKKNANILKRGPKSRTFDAKGYDKLIQAVGKSEVVMIGEASHGTFEFYSERAEITKRLIVEKKFNCIAIESDWPDAYKINRFVRGEDGLEAEDSLSEFKRFPRWMWRNEVMLDFVKWLREYNDKMDREERVGIYGMDLYSFFESAHEVISYLESVDPQLAKLAKRRYDCFQSYKNTKQYTLACAFNDKNCEDCVKTQLMDMIKRYETQKKKGSQSEEDFYSKMNAIVVKDAEEYYRKSFNEDTWNLRDTHMVDTLEQILNHSNDILKAKGSNEGAKCVVWAHNSHLGDASQTEMSKYGQVNVGQLVRKRFGKERCYNIGFTTHNGRVTAASDWDGPQEFKELNDSLEESYERILHDSQMENFYLIFRSNFEGVGVDKELNSELSKERMERYVGVIYRPDTELRSHYSNSKLSSEFDCVIHFDKTTALKPLDKSSLIQTDEAETWPTGL